MQKEAITAIKRAAEQSGTSPREVFDNIVVVLMTQTLTSPGGYCHLYLNPRYDPALAGQLEVPSDLMLFGGAVLAVLASLNAAAPFEDVITDYYGSLLAGVRGQFMTPVDFARTLMRLVDNPSGDHFAEPTCGTGALVMGYLRDRYEKDGAIGLRSVELTLNDMDLKLLRIAVLQVMFHTIKNEAPVASIKAFCADLILEYETPGKLVMVCTSHRHAMSSLFGGASG